MAMNFIIVTVVEKCYLNNRCQGDQYCLASGASFKQAFLENILHIVMFYFIKGICLE